MVPRADWEVHQKDCKSLIPPEPSPREEPPENKNRRNGLLTPPAEFHNRFTYFEDGKELRPGVIFEYYQGEWDKLPDFDKLKLSNAGEISTFTIDANTESNVLDKIGTNRGLLDAGNFAVRFTAYIDVPQTGQYTFYLTSNDGSALYIHDTKVVDNDGQHYSKEAEGQIELLKGTHPATVLFFHKNGKHLESYRSGPFLSVSYYCPGTYWVFANNTKQLLTKELLFYDYEDPRIRKLLDSNIEDSNKEEEKPPKVINLGPSAHQLKVQLEVANATIEDLTRIIHEQAESSKTKISSLERQLQQEREQILTTKKTLHLNRMFDDMPSSLGTRRGHGCYGQTTTSMYVDAQSELDLSVEEHGELEHQSVQEMLQKHLAEVDRLKQLYFYSMALSIKMIDKASSPNLAVHQLYEEIVLERNVSLKSWVNEVNLYLATKTN